MKLQDIRNKINSEEIDDIYDKEEEWEYAIQDAFHKDCGLYLDSELFEIFQLETKDDVLELVDALIQKVEQINGGQKAKKEAFNGAMDDSVAKYIYDTYVDNKPKDLYCGVPDVEFVYHGDWADPELIYQGKSYDYYDIEDPMWEAYNEDFPAPKDYNSDEYKEWEDRFDDYVRDNAYMVYDYLDNLNDCGAYYGGATYDDDELDESCGKKSRRKNKRTKKESVGNMDDIQKYLNVIEDQGWWVGDIDSNGYVDIGFMSDAGEDFFFTINTDDIPKEVADYAFYFDPEEHAEMMSGVPGAPGMRALLEDADSIADYLDELVAALQKVK